MIARSLVIASLLTAPVASAQPYITLPEDVEWQQLRVRPTSSPHTEVVEFRGEGGRLGWLRVSPVSGVDRVDVHYVDRPPETFWTDRWSRARDQIIEVDPNARIRRLVIECRPSACGRYRVFAG